MDDSEIFVCQRCGKYLKEKGHCIIIEEGFDPDDCSHLLDDGICECCEECIYLCGLDV